MQHLTTLRSEHNYSSHHRGKSQVRIVTIFIVNDWNSSGNDIDNKYK